MSIDVRIRTEHDTDNVFLCTWPAEQLADLLPAIKCWDVVSDAGEDPDVYGQIVVESTAAFFEIVLSSSGAD